MDGGYIALCLVNSLTSLTSVGGNLLIILAIWRTPSLHTPSFLLLGCLGVTDFLIGLLTQPTFVLLYTLQKTETFVDAYCFFKSLVGFSGSIFVGNSFVVLTTIAIDKYLAIKLHLRYNELVTNSRTIIVVSCFFAVVVLWSVTMAYEYQTYNIIHVVAKVRGIFVVSFSNGSVYASVKRHQRQIHSQQHATAVEDKLNLRKIGKSVNTSLHLLVMFLVCCLPSNLGLAIALQFTGFVTPRVKNVILTLALTILWANATINPFIYCYRLQKIQRAVFKVLKDCFPFTVCSV